MHAGVHPDGEFVGIAPAEDQVIAPGIESDQIRLQGQCGAHLLIQDLMEQPSADCKIRVSEIFVPGAQFFRDPVRPASQAPRAARLRISYPFGKRITQGHIAAPRVQAGAGNNGATLRRTFGAGSVHPSILLLAGRTRHGGLFLAHPMRILELSCELRIALADRS
ncbi:hypothetical protein GCM10017710_31010 [Arthrobacter ramosus]